MWVMPLHVNQKSGYMMINECINVKETCGITVVSILLKIVYSSIPKRNTVLCHKPTEAP